MNDLKLYIFFRSFKGRCVATDFVDKIELQHRRCSSRDIRRGGAAGLRQEDQLLRCVWSAGGGEEPTEGVLRLVSLPDI